MSVLMRHLQDPILGSLRQYSLQAAQPVLRPAIKPQMHLFARFPYAQVTMYRCESLNAKYEICGTLSFDISQKSAVRVYDLAKFYFKPSNQDEELLLKLLLSDSRMECLEFQKDEDASSYGLRFIGDHNFMKSRMTIDDKFQIIKRFIDLEPSKNVEVTTSMTTTGLNAKPVYKKTPSQWDDLLHKAFISARSIQWLAMSKCNNQSITQLSKRLV